MQSVVGTVLSIQLVNAQLSYANKESLLETPAKLHQYPNVNINLIRLREEDTLNGNKTMP